MGQKVERRRRGRPTKDAKAKRAIFSTRITAELRVALERAAKDSGKSLSNEIEARLLRSFEHEAEIKRVLAAFGGEQNYAVLRFIAEVIRRIDAATGRRWTDDPWSFNQVRQAIAYLLDEWRPDGDVVKPATLPRFNPERIEELGVASARGLIAQLEFTEDDDAGSLGRIKRGLGDLLSRYGTFEP
jgi:hypothetical protein